MNKIIKALCLAMILGICVFAQTDNSDEYKKNEVFVGYSNQQVGLNFDRQTFNGFEGSYVRNFTRYVGVKGDVSGAYNSNTFTTGSLNSNGGFSTFRVEVDSSVYNFLGGVQFKDNANKGRLKPFGHALAGVAYRRFNTRNPRCVSNCNNTVSTPFLFNGSENGFSAAVGGGLDVKITDKIDIRALQVDYNPNFVNGGRSDNVRFSTGIVF